MPTLLDESTVDIAAQARAAGQTVQEFLRAQAARRRAKFYGKKPPEQPKQIVHVQAPAIDTGETERLAELGKAVKRMASQFSIATRLLEANGKIHPNVAMEGSRLYLMADIITFVCRRYGIERADFMSNRRFKPLRQPRFEFYWICRFCSCRSYPEIGRFMNGRDHTTVLHGIRLYERMQDFARDPATARPVSSLTRPELIIYTREQFEELMEAPQKNG